MKTSVQALLLDLLTGSYLAMTMHRVFWYRVFLSADAPVFAWWDVAWYMAIGGVFAAFVTVCGMSPGRRVIAGERASGFRGSFIGHVGWMLILSTFVTGWVVSRVNVVDLFSQQRLDAAGRLFRDLLNPDFADTRLLSDTVTSIVETLYIAFMATALALPVSFVLAFLSARNVMSQNLLTRSVYTVLRLVTNFTRSIEPLVWAVIFTVWVKVGPFPGMLALCVHTIASLAKQYSEQIEEVDRGPLEAIETTGARPLQGLWFAVVPQVFIPFLSFTIYRWDINVRMATIIGLVGVGGIGSMLIQYQMLADWRSVGMIVLVIAIVVWIMDYVSARIRESLR
ncbi:MAG: phosphonate ABC transporter, permease protein PhnE [Candidatus Kapaibacterium sp.]